MGIYTKYGRHCKAKAFLNWCHGHSGTPEDPSSNDFNTEDKSRIWFAFGMGSPSWENGNQPSEDMPKAPPTYSDQKLVSDPAGPFVDMLAGVSIIDSVDPIEVSPFNEFGDPALNPRDIPTYPTTYPDDILGAFSELEMEFLNETQVGNPLGHLGFFRGSATLIREVRAGESVIEIGSFNYGNRVWTKAAPSDYGTYVLVQSNVPPKGFSLNPLIDMGIQVRQVTVWRFNDHLSDLCDGVFSYRSSSHVFDLSSAGTSSGDTKAIRDMEFLLNDYTVSTTRVQNQIDRYGYVIGF